MTRHSGLLLHITSLPTRYGCGDFGPAAHAFARLLAAGGQRVWQFLPLNPVSPALGNSPYSSPSAFAGNTLLISPDMLVEEGIISPAQAEEHAHAFAAAPASTVDFALAAAERAKLLAAAYARWAGRLADLPGYAQFCAEHAHWLDEYAAFCAIKEEYNGAPWYAWPEGLARREPAALAPLLHARQERVQAERFAQYLFFRQLARLRAVCDDLGIRLMGDVPMYVTHDSADVWANPGYFQLDAQNMPVEVAGVPPDYFSATGQRWGNPLYNWDALAQDGFAWWVRRLRHNLGMAHLLRLDHFRAFCGFWAIPAGEDTAVNGEWRLAPGPALFKTLARDVADLALPPEESPGISPNTAAPARKQDVYTLHLSRTDMADMDMPSKAAPRLPFVAENLGVITPDVDALQHGYGLPGMKVLQFGFSGDLAENPHAPFNHEADSVVYTGTHDNDTSRAWFDALLPEERAQLERFVGYAVSPGNAARTLLRLALASPARLALIPVQDVLGLGAAARMNTPATPSGNWQWRMSAGQMNARYFAELKALTHLYGRS